MTKKWPKMTKNNQKWQKMTKNDQKWPNTTKKMAQNNSRRPKMTKNDTKKLSVTDRPTDGRTDKAGCRVACTRLKRNCQNLQTLIFLGVWANAFTARTAGDVGAGAVPMGATFDLRPGVAISETVPFGGVLSRKKACNYQFWLWPDRWADRTSTNSARSLSELDIQTFVTMEGWAAEAEVEAGVAISPTDISMSLASATTLVALALSPYTPDTSGVARGLSIVLCEEIISNFDWMNGLNGELN